MAPYVGDGASCTFDESCSLLACDENAECTVNGMTRACKCRAGYTGSGTTCTNVDECATATTCGANGKCVDSPGSYTCSCNPGFSGAKCETDACNPNPCASGLVCQRTAQGASCVPSCAPFCPAGAACSGDNQCISDATCDPQAQLCILNSCAGGAVVLQPDIDRLKYCGQISGSLSLEPTSTSGLLRLEFPYLKKVTGMLTLGGAEVKSISFPRLENVGSDLGCGTLGTVESLDAPMLRGVGGTLAIGLTSFSHVDLSRLETVGKDLQIFYNNYLNTLSLSSVKSVGGKVQLQALPLVRWSSIRSLATLGTSRTINDIGCSFCPDNADNRFMCMTGAGC